MAGQEQNGFSGGRRRGGSVGDRTDFYSNEKEVIFWEFVFDKRNAFALKKRKSQPICKDRVLFSIYRYAPKRCLKGTETGGDSVRIAPALRDACRRLPFAIENGPLRSSVHSLASRASATFPVQNGPDPRNSSDPDPAGFPAHRRSLDRHPLRFSPIRRGCPICSVAPPESYSAGGRRQEAAG